MAAHEDIQDTSVHSIDLSGSTTTARGVDGPLAARLCSVWVPAEAVVFFQVGVGTTIVDGITDLSVDGGPLPTGVWTAVPCNLPDAPGSESGRPTLYFQGDTSIHVRFTGRGLA